MIEPWPIIASVAIAAGCAALSVIVVLRRWAFVGEGIAHAGFGGIGTAWVLSLAIPVLASDAGVTLVAIAFCLAVGMAIAAMTRRQLLEADSAIGITLVASLAWGFIALALANAHGAKPLPWDRYLLGDIHSVTSRAAVAITLLCLTLLAVLYLLRKEILSYCFDPLVAEVSGVAVGFIHYLLILLLALVIVAGMGIVGNLLVPALLVLPGSTALQLSRRLAPVFIASFISAIASVLGGIALSQWLILPVGATMVACLLGLFLVALVFRKLTRRRRVSGVNPTIASSAASLQTAISGPLPRHRTNGRTSGLFSSARPICRQ